MTISEPAATRLRYLIDLTILVWIGWFAWFYAGFLLRDDLYLYGDHPGQFYRLWQLLGVIWPEEGRFIGWSPYWYAGYPEMQFYPPGFALAGWLIWMAGFQQLSLFLVYQILVFASFILPAITLYLFMAWGVGDRLAGLVTAWLAMTAPLPLGGALGVIIGLVGDRLAFSMVPLFLLAGLWLMRTEPNMVAWFSSGLILAAILLLHPYQAILPAVVLSLYALLSGQDWRRRFQWLSLVILLGFGLTAFWWFSLGVRRDFFIPLIEAPWLEIRTNLEAMTWFKGMGWLLAAAGLGALFRSKDRRGLFWAILLGGIGLLGFIYLDYHLLVEKLNFYAIDPVRLIPGVTFVLFVGLGLGVSELAWFTPRLLQRWGRSALGWPFLLIVPWLIYNQVIANYDFPKWISKWQPSPERTPMFLSEAEARYQLQAVWAGMAATPGRVLFTSYYGLLFDVPTSLKAATPILSGREIIGGTFTHRAPVFGYLWTGQATAPVLRGKIEKQDDKTLAGVAWEKMTDEFLFDLARRFNVTLIGTTALDTRARGFLDASSRFKPVWSNGLFTFYEVVGYQPTWVEANQAQAAVNRYERTAIDVAIREAAAGANLSIKLAYYPLWQAEVNGQTLRIEPDNYGLMQLALPPGSYTLYLRYKPGWPERLGEIISLATLVAALGLMIYWSKDGLRQQRLNSDRPFALVSLQPVIWAYRTVRNKQARFAAPGSQGKQYSNKSAHPPWSTEDRRYRSDS